MSYQPFSYERWARFDTVYRNRGDAVAAARRMRGHDPWRVYRVVSAKGGYQVEAAGRMDSGSMRAARQYNKSIRQDESGQRKLGL